MKTIDVRDLVAGRDGRGTPWSEMNCAAIAREALARAGVRCPWLDVWTGAPEGPRDERAFEDVLAAASASWERVARAERVGDLIVQTSTDGAHRYHLSVVVDPMGPLAATSTRAAGAHLVRVNRLARVHSTWRWKPAGVTT